MLPWKVSQSPRCASTCDWTSSHWNVKKHLVNKECHCEVRVYGSSGEEMGEAGYYAESTKNNSVGASIWVKSTEC